MGGTIEPSTLVISAPDQKVGLTLEELAIVCQEAYRGNVERSSQIRVRVGWHGQIRQLTIIPPPEPIPEPS